MPDEHVHPKFHKLRVFSWCEHFYSKLNYTGCVVSYFLSFKVIKLFFVVVVFVGFVNVMRLNLRSVLVGFNSFNS